MDEGPICHRLQSYMTACESVMAGDGAAAAAGSGTWAALVLAVCLVCSEGRRGNPRERNTADHDNDPLGELQVGRSMNILPRYGYLALSIKVFPHRTDNDWIFRETTMELFQRNSYWTTYSPSEPRGYDEHFLLDFCDDTRELFRAYFENFEIEGVSEPYRVFTNSLSARTKAQHLGIHSTFLSDEYSFVLVRLFRRSRRASFTGNVTLNAHFKSGIRDIRVGSSESVNQFIDNFGTHVITEYETGDVMYQVYAFGDRIYRYVKSKFALSRSSTMELAKMNTYFTPYYALHVGKVKLASGHPDFDHDVGNALKFLPYYQYYQSIFSFFNQPKLKDRLLEMKGDVIISLKMEKITAVVPKTPERAWLGEILDNTLTLYYVSL
ncbi:membrane-attack complex domain containing protein torso-like isoform X2 [Oratosquilla oratoria]|uniref:membrane-attack complex domain containing protein torso-like isoform X2 n=1 Tax=Oratosquilla oratoria TaxID=337810 RepID=UPI003F75D215